jgi:hypothetical protein
LGLKPVCFDTRPVTDPAAASGLIVEPQPASTIASEALKTINAVRIAAVFNNTVFQTTRIRDNTNKSGKLCADNQAADVTR